MSAEVGTITRNGVEIPVQFNQHSGQFSATVGDQSFAEETWEAIGSRIDKATKRVRKVVSVPFVAVANTYHGLKFKDGTATGLHSSNGNVLVTWENGDKEQYKQHWSGDGVYQPLSDVERAELVSLTEAAEKARDALNEFTEPRKIKLKDLVSKALTQAQ